MKNHHCLESLIVERYIIEELAELYSNYLSEEDSVGVPKSRHDGRYEDKGSQGLNVNLMAHDVVIQAHLYIFNNVDEVQSYLSAHKRLIK